ncbi:hypothetical protein [Ponticaulis sp.]|uniref:hypothetical protein n=1 Tax=Ponticaulis sp. TaxID=2020902 RepID=UPI000FF02B0F|nr:hypothetical protein [Ponticaulis sp.]MDF1679901.1 hypothetical protein [Ponticaulis sp.]RPG18757.1 MAG: hypothetical protein CBC85_000535 [Hyphomonadaceae bacterium TMED125]
MFTGRSSNGTMTGMFIMGAAIVLTAAAVLSGRFHVQAAGLDVTMGTHIDRGFVVQIDGLDCPGADCPAFAFDWSLATRG